MLDVKDIERRAQAVAEAYSERLGDPGSTARPTVHPGYHEASSAPFIVSWEDGPFQWPYQLDLAFDIGERCGVSLEAVNHFAIAVYPR